MVARGTQIPKGIYLPSTLENLLSPTDDALDQGSANFFSVQGHIVNILDFVGHRVSVRTTQLCPCSMKAGIDST